MNVKDEFSEYIAESNNLNISVTDFMILNKIPAIEKNKLEEASWFKELNQQLLLKKKWLIEKEMIEKGKGLSVLAGLEAEVNKEFILNIVGTPPRSIFDMVKKMELGESTEFTLESYIRENYPNVIEIVQKILSEKSIETNKTNLSNLSQEIKIEEENKAEHLNKEDKAAKFGNAETPEDENYLEVIMSMSDSAFKIINKTNGTKHVGKFNTELEAINFLTKILNGKEEFIKQITPSLDQIT